MNSKNSIANNTSMYCLAILLLLTSLSAETVDEAMEGFEDTPITSVKIVKKPIIGEDKSNSIMDGFDDDSDTYTGLESNLSEIAEDNGKEESVVSDFTGKLTQQVAYSYAAKKPHDNFTSFKSSLLLDYEHKFENGWRFKANAKAYYDSIYDLRDEDYTKGELNELRTEVELYDAYFEGEIVDSLDIKIGRQVVVWGRSDTVRITDVLNPLDNRRPGMVDIEDLRLPVTMVKLDYFIGDWRISPIAILEQRFTKKPPFASAFYPLPVKAPRDESYDDITYALSLGATFSGWDISFYAAKIRDDSGYILMSKKPKMQHNKIKMLGSAINILSGPWLFKSELAYFDGLKYTSTQKKEFSKLDTLVGVEYKGIADTTISYDISLRHVNSYDISLLNEFNPLEEDTYQHAFRVSSDFMNATMTANYLISLYGKKLNEGAFQRAWIKYELGEGINTNFGVVDYIGGGVFFDAIKDNDMLFADISYNF